MAKKEGDKLKNIKTVILQAISKVIHSKLEDFTYHLKERINHTVKVIVERIFSSILMIIAFIFLILAFTYYLIEYQYFTKTGAFLITAGALFLVSFIIKYHSLKK